MNEGRLKMIRFADFLPVPEPSRTKVKFNMKAGTDGPAAWDLLLADDQEAWLNMTRYRTEGRGYGNNNLDHADYVLSFAQYYPYGPRYYVFGGFFGVEKIEPAVTNGIGYRLFPLEAHADYIKRLIVKLDCPVGRDSYLRKYENLQESKLKPVVYELAPDTKLGTFSGFQNVKIRHSALQRILASKEPTWRDALSSVKGVYVITDLSNGQLYVGSASSETDGLWQRWASYGDLRNLTGGNVKLEKVRRDLGDEHLIENFQYSILEIFDPKTPSEKVLQREAFWKSALDSRRHGMNSN